MKSTFVPVRAYANNLHNIQNQGQARQNEAQAKSDLSHSSAKEGPYTAAAGDQGVAVAKDHPDRTTGQWNQTVGSGKEYLGNLTGSEQMKKEGAQQNREGKGQEAQGQLNDYASGMGQRMEGKLGGAVAGMKGDKQEFEQKMDKHDTGKTLQRGAESDMQKQA